MIGLVGTTWHSQFVILKPSNTRSTSVKKLYIGIVHHSIQHQHDFAKNIMKNSWVMVLISRFAELTLRTRGPGFNFYQLHTFNRK